MVFCYRHTKSFKFAMKRQFLASDSLSLGPQETPGTSIEGVTMDRFHSTGAGFRYISTRNAHGAGEKISIHFRFFAQMLENNTQASKLSSSAWRFVMATHVNLTLEKDNRKSNWQHFSLVTVQKPKSNFVTESKVRYFLDSISKQCYLQGWIYIL